ncbi:MULTISPECIES: helix-turn-helix transcriptional regulator [Halorussus]|uniref:DUF7351 domain-containing protein n=1 Tax=Halorussus TaxID=1070314 RepID=UPI000E216CE8|nr:MULTISPECIES: helix-turn-helix transcriptional regulator [Halorussus]NHN59028.1 helix-turn-helix transcriptional regulator [Halorussus sp. JP-T4]
MSNDASSTDRESPDLGNGPERAASLSLDEALSIVGEPTRATIVLELGEARSADPATSDALTFTELMERTGVEDSGRFNYHLDKLVGTFVEKGDDGYGLSLPGQMLHQAFVAGTLTDRLAVDPFPVGDCPECEGRLAASYRPDHVLIVECEGRERLFDAAHFPTRGVEVRSQSELLDAVYRRRHHKIAVMRRGVCHGCGGRIERRLGHNESVADSCGGDPLSCLESYAVLACEECATSLAGHPANVAVTAPEVVGFFAEHGREAARSRWWNDPIAAARESIEVVGTDPVSVAVPYEIDGEQLRVVLDDRLQVVQTERSVV